MRQVAVDERGAGQRLDNFLGANPRRCAPQPYFPRDSQGRGARSTASAPSPRRGCRQATSCGSRRCAPATSAHHRGARPGALVESVIARHRVRGPATAGHRQAGGRRRARRQRRELRRHRGAARRASATRPSNSCIALDRDTSGLLLVARKPASAAHAACAAARGTGREALSRAGEGQVGAGQETHRRAVAHRHSRRRRAHGERRMPRARKR